MPFALVSLKTRELELLLKTAILIAQKDENLRGSESVERRNPARCKDEEEQDEGKYRGENGRKL